MSNWISVKDRLPEEGKDVLIVDDAKRITIAHWFMDKTLGVFWTNGSQHYISITHYMPLPEPPKE